MNQAARRTARRGATDPPPAPRPTLPVRIDRFCERHARAILAVMITAWAVVFSSFAWIKYRHYLYSDIDLAIFVQAVDGLLHGTLYSSIRSMNWLGDHSSLILFLIAPIYAVARHPVTLPIIQCVMLALGAIPVHRMARLELGPGFAPLAFAAAYLLYPAVGHTALYEFHPDVLCTSLLLATIASYRAGRLKLTILFAGLSLLGKEDIALAIAALAVHALLTRRPRYATALGGLTVLSLIVTFAVLKPWLNTGEVDYGRLYERWGTGPGGVLMGIMKRPLAAVAHLVLTPGSAYDTMLKLQYHTHMLLPLLFLPLASPFFLALALPTLASRFLAWTLPMHTILYQYTAAVTPFVFAAGINGLRNLLVRHEHRGIVGGNDTREPAWRGPLWLRPAVMLAVLIASVYSSWMYGPFFGHGRFRLVEETTMSAMDRTLTPYRDAMMTTLGSRDSVVAGFEFLSRLATRRNTRSFHNIVEGRYTFSLQPFPVPVDVSALIADVGHLRLRPFPNAGTYQRLRSLVEGNRLGLVSAVGDMLLFLRDAPDSVRLWQVGEAPIARPQRVVFDRQLAYLGVEYITDQVAPGGVMPIRTFWRKVAPTDSLFMLRLTAYDAQDHATFSYMRYLGYLFHPAAEWPDTTMVAETWRMVIPDDAKPGTYMLGMRVGRREEGGEQVICEPDDPVVRAQSYVVELGRFTIMPRP